MTKSELLERINAHRFSRIILTAFELDLFTALAAGGLTPLQVARRRRTDPRATDRLLRALRALGLLRSARQVFYLTPFSKRTLVRGAPEYLAGVHHSLRQFQSWAHLTSAVREGRATPEARAKDRGGEWQEGFISAMHDRARPEAERLLRLADAQNASHLLDIGAGSGVYAMAFLGMNRQARATLFDLPAVIPITRRYVAAAGLQARVRFIAGDFNRDPLGEGYDLVLLSAIIHMQSLEKNRRLLRRIYRVLRPGGRVIIQDYLMNEDRSRPEMGVFFALNMLVNTEEGDTFTCSEVKELLRSCGFTRVRIIRTPIPAALAVGWKPSR